jgi:DNA polymerase III subunit delta'
LFNGVTKIKKLFYLPLTLLYINTILTANFNGTAPPVLFNKIIGQSALKKRLVQSVKDRRISHAQLFFGPEGTGALALTLAYAQYISCTGEKDTDACGKCPSCLKYAKLIHPDLHFVYPVNNTAAKKDDPYCDDFLPEWRNFVLQNPYGRLHDWYNFIELENKQGIIKEKESDAISRKLSYKSFESDFKIIIIWMAEKMHDVASNKLLKLLEEPPELTIFLLITENPEMLLTTIRSRCFPVRVPLIANEDINSTLQHTHQLDATKSDSITRLAAGNYALALELLREEEDEGFHLSTFRDFMLAGYRNDIATGMKTIETLNSLTREKQKAFLDYALKLIRENAMLRFNNPDMIFMNQKESLFSANFSKFVRDNNIVPLAGEFNKAVYDIERNGNSKIILLDLMLKTGKLLRQ